MVRVSFLGVLPLLAALLDMGTGYDNVPEIMIVQHGESVYKQFNLPDHRPETTNERNKADKELESSVIAEPQCFSYLDRLAQINSSDLWVKRMLQSQGTTQRGIQTYQDASLGDYDDCLRIEDPDSSLTSKYCLATVHDSQVIYRKRSFRRRNQIGQHLSQNFTDIRPVDKFLLGICIPQNCRLSDLKRNFFNLFIMPTETLEFKEVDCVDNETYELDIKCILFLCTMGLIVIIVVLTTIYEGFVWYVRGYLPAKTLLLTFSVNSSFKLLVREVESDMAFLDGIITLSIFWLLILRRSIFYLSLYYPLLNSHEFFLWIFGMGGMHVFGSSLAADTLLTVCGVKIMYTYLSVMQANKSLNWSYHLLARVLKVIPFVCLELAFTCTCLRFSGDGPLWKANIDNYIVETCNKYWHLTLLQVQHIALESSNMCLPHLWLINVENLFYLMSPLLLMFFISKPNWHLIGYGICIFILLSITTVLIFVLPVPGNIADQVYNGTFLRICYFLPVIRMVPIFVGLIAGYLVQEYSKDLVFSALATTLLWSVSITTIVICTTMGGFAFSNESIPQFAALFTVFARFVWSVAISLIIVLLAGGKGGFINTFLSCKFFRIVSRLSYLVYATHYLVIASVMSSNRTLDYFSFFRLIYLIWGDNVYTLLISIVCFYLFQAPMINFWLTLGFGTDADEDINENLGF